MISGIFYGIGVGPGDPELITLKAQRLIQNADVISYIVNASNYSMAREIVEHAVAENQNAIILPIVIEMCRDRVQAGLAYDEAAKAIAAELVQQRDVVFLCAGDPLFYGSFSYLLERLSGHYPTQVIPGISSIHSATAAALTPLAMLTDKVAILNGRCADADILHALKNFDSLLILKAGVSRQKLLSLFAQADRSQDVIYLAHIAGDKQHIEFNIEALHEQDGPYFSLFLVSKYKHLIKKS